MSVPSQKVLLLGSSFGYNYTVGGHVGVLKLLMKIGQKVIMMAKIVGLMTTIIVIVWYKGDATKPAISDRRVWKQDYSGVVSK